MISDMTKLYNTLKLIETKGENTKTMADCLRFLEQMIARAGEMANEADTKED